MDLDKIIARLTELETTAREHMAKAEASTDLEEVKGLKAMVEDTILPEIETLKSARAEAERLEEQKAMRAKVTSLEEVINDLRKPIVPSFAIGSTKAAADGESPYDSGEFSFFADVKAANKGRQDAIERLAAASGVEGKAMTEGTGAQGGYLVQKQIEREIVNALEQDNILRALCSKLSVSTNQIELNQISFGTTAGWVAELAAKPESTSFSLATLTASVFTAAGLATISNQLLADSNPAADRLVVGDIAKRLVALEEVAFLVGTGSGQPLGILNTPGLSTTPITGTAVTDTLDAILAAIGNVETLHGSPTAIVMHPRTWTRILQSKDAVDRYRIDPTSTVQDPRTGQRGPTKSLFGYRVVTSNRVPTNLGTGTNESRIIVGDFSEALILDRQGITVDESPHVFFTTNQTVFRAEMRVGFTAARRPTAFNVIGGVGLVGN